MTVEVSVVTTSMNYGKYIEDCIQSVLNQKASFPFKINHIVMDGGSTDETDEILERYSDKIHSHINKGEGQTVALNHAMKIIKARFPETEYVGWINADDYYSPNWLESSISTFKREFYDVAVTCSNHTRICTIEGGGFIKAKVDFQGHKNYVDLERMLEANSICQPTICIKLSAFNDIKKWEGHYFNPHLHYTQDYEVWLTLLFHRYKIRRIRDYLATLRVHPLRLTETHSDKQAIEEKQLRETMRKRAVK